MKVEKFSLKRKKAYKLWQDYVKACKDNPKDKFLQDMKKVYNQLKSGRKVIDITEVFKRSGLNMDGDPNLAIAPANLKEILCQYDEDGTVTFVRSFWKPNWDIDVIIKDTFPNLPKEQWQGQYSRYKRIEAPVPVIPASIRPKGNLANYYILWEVEKWKPVPPKDPYLLRRLTKNMFVVVAGWKLTKLERSVMKGRVY